VDATAGGFVDNRRLRVAPREASCEAARARSTEVGMKRALTLTFVLTVTGAAITAAQTTASIYGAITDETKGALAGVTVSAVHAATGETRTAQTGTGGNYTLPGMPLGTYTVRAELPGFRAVTRAGIEISLDRHARVDLVLVVGQVTETVVVTADAPLVESSTNEMGTVIDRRRIAGLPINGRNTLSLVSLVPGAQEVQSTAEQGFVINKVAFNGVRPELSNWLLDGGDNTSSLRNYGNPVPNPDAVEEFRVISNNYSAEYGRSAGAIVSVATRSGTNELRGTAFEFLRNDALNGDDFFQGKPGKLDQHQFGATLGGPILKDRLFFFGSYQGFRRNTEEFKNTALVPTPAERRGDFSQSVFQGRPVTIVDPLTGQPFPGNVIPAARVSPIATRYLDMVVPLPNDPSRGPNAHRVTVPVSDPSDQILGKVDFLASKAHKLTLSWFYNDFTDVDVLSPFAFYYRDNVNTQHTVTLHEHWTPRSNVVNHLRMSYNRTSGDRTMRTEPAFTAADLGITFGALPAGPVLSPSFRFTGYFDAAAAAGGPKTSNIYSVADSVDLVKGRHNLKFGGEVWLRRLFDVTLDDRNGGDFRFNGRVTGNAIGDFLLGEVSDRFRFRDAAYKSNNQWSYYAYVQDNFRVTPRLTLNLGVRYELDRFPVSPGDPVQVWQAGRTSACVPQAPRGLLYASCEQDGTSRSGYDDDTNNFAPRLGFAYTLTGDGKTVVRGGYGISHASNILNTLQEGLVGVPWGFREDVLNTGAANRPSTVKLASPFAGFPGGNPFPFRPDPANLRYPASTNYTAASPSLHQGYYHQYNLTLQRQFGTGTVIELAYVGNRGQDLPASVNINQPVLSPTGTAANANARRPLGDPRITDLVQYVNVGQSWYDSLQARLEQRLQGGFSLLGSYTFGKAIDLVSWHDDQGRWADPTRPELNKGPADFDRRHLLTVSFLWDLPFFKDAKGLSSALGGWQVNGIASYYSGLPIDVRSGRDNNLDTQAGNDRPNLVGDWRKPTPSHQQIRAGETWFNTAAFAPNGVGQIGTLGRNALVGPERKVVDLGLSKDFRLGSRGHLIFRLEAFNVFNWVNFTSLSTGGTPSSPQNLTSGNFGKVTSAGSPRVVQLGLKVMF
jgi:outer membrane receptor protein involved in Fe transport